MNLLRALFETISSPSWLLFWETVEFFSIIVVILGCWGEGWAEHHSFADAFASPKPIISSKDKWMRRFWAMVVIGLGIEMIAFGLSFIGSNREIDGLKADNARLFAIGERAKQAAAQAVEASEKAKKEREIAEAGRLELENGGWC